MHLHLLLISIPLLQIHLCFFLNFIDPTYYSLPCSFDLLLIHLATVLSPSPLLVHLLKQLLSSTWLNSIPFLISLRKIAATCFEDDLLLNKRERREQFEVAAAVR
jgi:hypothetical protein